MRQLKRGDRLLDRYEIGQWVVPAEGGQEIRPYLEGGLGVVYRAYDLVVGDPVVLKTYKGPVSRSSRPAALFRQEAETWVRIGRHRNIVQAYNVVDHDERLYVVMEFVPGGSLRTRLRHLSTPQALAVAIGICRGMVHADETVQMVHRDLKPENVLVAENDVAKVTDFGLARIMQEETLRHAGPAGTRGYMAPEQVKDARGVDTRADIYAYGIILHELLTGRRPFQEPMLPPDLFGALTNQTGGVIARCVRPDPLERFACFQEVLQELLPIAESCGIREPTPVEPRESDRIHDVMLAIPSISARIRADSFYRLDKFEDAVKCYTELLGERSIDASSFARRGICFLELEQTAEAEADLDRALEIDGDCAEALVGKGDLCVIRGQFPEAAGYYGKAAEADPNAWETALQHEAIAMEKAGHLDEALACYDRILERSPEARLLISKAILLRSLDRYEEAIALCEQALRIEPDSMRALGVKADLHDWMNRPDMAIECFRRLIKLDPDLDKPWALNRMGICHAQMGDFSRALECHQAAARMEPEELEYALNVGTDLEKMGFWPQARDHYERLVDGCPVSADLWYRLGHARAEVGDIVEARDALKKCLEMQDHSHARFLLHHLDQ